MRYGKASSNCEPAKIRDASFHNGGGCCMTLDRSVESEIVNTGKKDYFVNKGIYKNPHPYGSPEFNAYERGWMQSLKFDNGRLVDLAKRPAAKPAASKPVVNQYALMKGRDSPRK